MRTVNVGIDLGTTYSAVAVFSAQSGKVEILKNSLGKEVTPSVLCIENGRTLIGEEAKEEQKSGNVNTVAFYKSMMGNPDFSAYLDGNEYSAEDLSGIFLTELKRDVEQTNDVKITGAVITVPAYFNDKQREATIRAGQRAGLNVLKIINEPTAAIIAYGLTGGKDKNVMVYDLGGGTFDVTIARVVGTSISVTATNGNHQLGGMNWDETLIQEVADQFYSEFGVDIKEHAEDYKELQVRCEEAKKRLSSVSKTLIQASCEGNSGKYEVTRELFDERTASLLNETFSLINKCFEEISQAQNTRFGWE
ncbi:MAG: Hsp70 family protein, partial [Candidatus Coproplasma sp.]